MTEALLIPDWPAPSHIKACVTTRAGGISLPPFDTLNLGDHVGDRPALVAANRQRLIPLAQLPTAPLWLKQTHSTRVIDETDWVDGIEADGLITDQTDQVCVVMTADCLPVLITDRKGTQVAAVHAGWRGLLHGILENGVKQFQAPPAHLLVWLGPAIGPQHFEVGTEVFNAFTQADPQAASAFQQTDDQHCLADLYQLARQRLQRLGITAVFGGEYCTVSDAERFFSYRRDQRTGRMASLIWKIAE